MENTETNNEENNDGLDGVRSPEAQAIIDKELGVVNEDNENKEEDIVLPSDEGDDNEGEDRVYANKYKSVEELKKGIENIGSTLPDYVINGMSDEALEKHYTELNKEFSKGNKEGRKHIEKKEDDTKKESKSEDKPKEVSDELWKELDSTFTDTGNITSEQYDKLNKIGIPDGMVDRYLDGLKSKQVTFTKEVYAMAGGEEQYKEIKSWAEDNLPQEELEAISGMKDYSQIQLALRGVKAMYDASNGTQGNTIRGNGTTSSVSGYRSEAEYFADVRDPRYNSDGRFRDKVRAKFAKSNLAS